MLGSATLPADLFHSVTFLRQTITALRPAFVCLAAVAHLVIHIVSEAALRSALGPFRRAGVNLLFIHDKSPPLYCFANLSHLRFARITRATAVPL